MSQQIFSAFAENVLDKQLRRLWNNNIDNCLKGVDTIEQMKKPPDAEFGIMKAVWASEPPITTSIIMEQLGNAIVEVNMPGNAVVPMFQAGEGIPIAAPR